VRCRPELVQCRHMAHHASHVVQAVACLVHVVVIPALIHLNNLVLSILTAPACPICLFLFISEVLCCYYSLYSQGHDQRPASPRFGGAVHTGGYHHYRRCFEISVALFPHRLAMR
jgi:hypothetical protein